MFLIANIIEAVAVVGHMLVNAYIIVVLAACVVSWFNVSPYSPVCRVLYNLTEPVFYRIRRRLSFAQVGGMDFTPVIVIVALELFDLVVFKSMRQLAYGL